MSKLFKTKFLICLATLGFLLQIPVSQATNKFKSVKEEFPLLGYNSQHEDALMIAIEEALRIKRKKGVKTDDWDFLLKNKGLVIRIFNNRKKDHYRHQERDKEKKENFKRRQVKDQSQSVEMSDVEKQRQIKQKMKLFEPLEGGDFSRAMKLYSDGKKTSEIARELDISWYKANNYVKHFTNPIFFRRVASISATALAIHLKKRRLARFSAAIGFSIEVNGISEAGAAEARTGQVRTVRPAIHKNLGDTYTEIEMLDQILKLADCRNQLFRNKYCKFIWTDFRQNPFTTFGNPRVTTDLITRYFQFCNQESCPKQNRYHRYLSMLNKQRN